MIHFSLTCDKNHQFEGWFRNNADYEDQLSCGHLACPFCNSTTISKSLMAPAVSTSRRKAKRKSVEEKGVTNTKSQKSPSKRKKLAVIDKEEQEFMSMLRELKDKLVKNADDVGDNFAEEARKIHYGESEKTGVYGSANPAEVRKLREEGIEFFALPTLPEDQN